MASQYGDTREYTSTDEATSPQLQTCPVCKVKTVPRGITSTRKAGVVSGELHCPNCGHILDRSAPM